MTTLTLNIPLEVVSAEERELARANAIPYIGVYGRLYVPIEKTWDVDPVIEGWKPYWVNVNLSASPQKWTLYKRTESPTSDELWDAYKVARDSA